VHYRDQGHPADRSLHADGGRHKGSFVIIAPESQTEYAVSPGIKAISREMKKMAMGVSFTKTDLLSAPERAKNADAQAKISMLAGMVKSQNMELQNLTEKKL
jgi:hypothetical protein